VERESTDITNAGMDYTNGLVYKQPLHFSTLHSLEMGMALLNKAHTVLESLLCSFVSVNCGMFDLWQSSLTISSYCITGHGGENDSWCGVLLDMNGLFAFT